MISPFTTIPVEVLDILLSTNESPSKYGIAPSVRFQKSSRNSFWISHEALKIVLIMYQKVPVLLDACKLSTFFSTSCISAGVAAYIGWNTIVKITSKLNILLFFILFDYIENRTLICIKIIFFS